MSDLVGQTLAGRYDVRAFLGKGATAHVYQIWDRTRSANLVAKVLLSSTARYADFWDRFRIEAQTLARLRHPHIVPFYSFEDDGSLTFMVLGYIDGSDLRARIASLKNRPLAEAAILDVMHPLCSALSYAHQMGVIHCDVKPSNVLIASTGQIYITDFGIAHVAREARFEMPSGGTPAYMAPEQVLNEHLLPQTDIYALGVILYELVTGGMRPFRGDQAPIRGNSADRMRWEQAHLAPPSPLRFNPSLSSNMERVVMRCLTKLPQDRFESTLALLDAVEQALPKNSSTTYPTTEAGPQTSGVSRDTSSKVMQQRRPVWLWVAAACIVGVLALGIGLLSVPQSSARPPAVPSLKPNAAASLPLETGSTISPQQSTSAIYTVHECVSVFVPVYSATTTECVTGVTILPDGRMQFDFSWALQANNALQIQKSPDTDNPNMYLTDSAGRRLDHIATGGAAAQSVTLQNGETQTGWFVFPPAAPQATYFIFHDDDNHIQTKPIPRLWP